MEISFQGFLKTTMEVTFQGFENNFLKDAQTGSHRVRQFVYRCFW